MTQQLSSMTYKEVQEKCYDVLSNMGTQEAIDTILNYHGMQLLDENFLSSMIEDGIVDDISNEEEDEDDSEVFGDLYPEEVVLDRPQEEIAEMVRKHNEKVRAEVDMERLAQNLDTYQQNKL